MRRLRNAEKYITPQQVYGIMEGKTCRECRFCSNKKDTGLIGSDKFYCTRFWRQENPKARINAYDQACGKFERKNCNA